MRNAKIEVRPIAGTIGAELHGVDISTDLPDATIAEIRQALLDHCVIFFRDQKLDVPQQKAFARRFGDLFIHPNYKGLQADSEIVEIKRAPGDKKIVGEEWHADTTMVSEPPMGAILYAIEVPPYGGDTLFANQYQAYDALSAGMKKLIADLHAIHFSGSRQLGTTTADQAHAAEQKKISPPVAHPVVRVHPDTGRKAIYLGEKVRRFDAMTEEESRPLIEYLNRHATRPEFVYRHQWRAHDILLWDNRCTMHQALGDFDQTQSRYMERTTVIGTPSGYVVEAA